MSKKIELENVQKKFGNFVAVDNLNITVEPGELLVLLGPSGCGKTTTLRMIAGLETPTNGSIFFDDEDVSQKMPQSRDASMVFQNYALYPHLTVADNLQFPLLKTEMAENEMEEKVLEIAKLLEIEDQLNKTPGELSGGQQQRAAVGRTLTKNPSVFLMDEPLSNLDAKLRVQTRAEIRKLQQQFGTTTIYVTHDQEEAMSIADKIAIMYDGKLQQVGSPKDIYLNPSNQFVGGFMGQPSMNFIEFKHFKNTFDIIEGSLGGEVRSQKGIINVGIRAEDISLYEYNDSEEALPVNIDLIEPLGSEYEVSIELNGNKIRCLTSEIPESLSEGEQASVRVRKDDLSFFDRNGDIIGGEYDGRN